VNAKYLLSFVVLLTTTAQSTIDKQGKIDYGNIEVFEKNISGFYIEGNFGKVALQNGVYN